MLGRLMRLGREEKPKISRRESLRGVPVISGGVSSREGPGGERLLVIPRQTAFAPLIRWFGGPTDAPPKRVVLDDLGNSVWKKIDGRRNVGDIIRLFGKETGLHHREAEAGVVEFLNLLMRRGVVSILFE